MAPGGLGTDTGGSIRIPAAHCGIAGLRPTLGRYAGEGIAQILFLRAEAVCQTSYADKKGKYQDQKGLTLPFVVGDNHRHK